MVDAVCISPDPANGATYDPAYVSSTDDFGPQRISVREPYWHTDDSAAYDGDVYRDPVANFHAFANVQSISLGLNPTPYVPRARWY